MSAFECSKGKYQTPKAFLANNYFLFSALKKSRLVILASFYPDRKTQHLESEIIIRNTQKPQHST